MKCQWPSAAQKGIRNFIDIMLISETYFTDRSYFNIPKYLTYSTNHPDNRVHGRTAILTKKTINHYELPKYKSNHLQAAVIKVKMTQYELTVAAVYCPPKYNIKKRTLKILSNVGTEVCSRWRL
jgi:hypothetical protein